MNHLENIDTDTLIDMSNRIFTHIECSTGVCFTYLLEAHLNEVEAELNKRKLNNIT